MSAKAAPMSAHIVPGRVGPASAMPDDASIPGESPAAIPPEALRQLAQGEASLMLLECLILELCEQRVLQRDALLKSIETAIAAKRRLVEEQEHAAISRVAIGIL